MDLASWHVVVTSPGKKTGLREEEQQAWFVRSDDEVAILAEGRNAVTENAVREGASASSSTACGGGWRF